MTDRGNRQQIDGARRRVAVAVALALCAALLVLVPAPPASATVVNASLFIEADGTPDGGVWGPADGGGLDSGPNNGWVRTLDTVEYRVAFDMNGGPGADDFTISGTLPEGLVFDLLPFLCRTENVNPVSSLSADGRTIVCNLGDLPSGYSAELPLLVHPLTSVSDGTVLASRFDYQHTEGATVVSGSTNSVDVQVSAGASVDLVQNDFTSSVPGQLFQVEWGPTDGPSVVAGQVFDDSDGDGRRDPGEPGRASVQVGVFEPGGSAVLDAGGSPVVVTTDGSGVFVTSPVRPGTVVVRPVDPLDGGERYTSPMSYTRTAQGQPLGGNDFAVTTVAAGVGDASLGGVVFDDRDQNGVFGAGDVGREGAEVSVTGFSDAGAAVNLSTESDAAGLYRLDGVPPSDANGYVVTARGRGLETVAESIVLPVAAGTSRLDLDFGHTTYERYGQGVGIRWPFALMGGPNGKGSQELTDGAFGFVDRASDISPNTMLMHWSEPCSINGDGVDLLPLPAGSGGGPTVPHAVANSGSVTCAQPVAGADIAVSVDGADTSGSHLPTQAFNGDSVPADDHYLVTGYVSTFTPASDLPACGETTVLSNTFTSLSGLDLDGDPLVDADPLNDAHEREILVPSCNNADSGYVPRMEFRAAEDDAWAPLPQYDYLNGEDWSRWGDGYVGDGTPYSVYMSSANTNQAFDQAVVQCLTLDNSRHHLADRPFLTTPTAVELTNPAENNPLVRVFDDDGDPSTLAPVANGQFVIEYGASGSGDTSGWAGGSGPRYFASHGEQQAATRCGPGEVGDSSVGWYTDPDLVPGGLTAVNQVRLRAPRLEPGDVIVARFELGTTDHGASPARDPGAGAGDPWGFGTELRAYMSFSLNDVWRDCCEWQRRVLVGQELVRVDKLIDPDDTLTTEVLAGDTVNFRLEPTANSLVPTLGSVVSSVVLVDVMPARLSYVDGSADPAPSSIDVDADGVTTLTWDFGDVPSEVELPSVRYSARVDRDALNGEVFTNTAVISSPDDPSPVQQRSSERFVSVVAPLAFQVWKDAVEPIVEPGQPFAYELNWVNRGSQDLGTQDLIDVLPRVGDARTPASSFTGQLSLDPSAPVDPGAHLGDTTVYVTAAPAGSVVGDPIDPSNDLAAGSTQWCVLDDVLAASAPVGCPAADLTDATALRAINTASLGVADEARSLVVNLVGPATVAGDVMSNGFGAHVAGVTNTAQSEDVAVRVADFSVGGTAFHDLDGDGYRGPSEPGLAGVAVRVVGTTGGGAPVDESTVTDVDGEYAFAVSSGDYRVEFTRPTGFAYWSPTRSGLVGDGSDVDPASPDAPIAETAVFSLPDATGAEWNAGVFNPVSVGDQVFHDVDGDGQRELGEGGIGGVQVTLLDGAGTPVTATASGAGVSPTLTASDGIYGFSDLLPGDYRLRFVMPDATPGDPSDDWHFTMPNIGAPESDSDADPATGVTPAVAVLSGTPGGADVTVDAGAARLAVIGGVAFQDVDQSGLLGSGDPRLADISVRLLDGAGVPVPDGGGAPLVTTTAADGSYRFPGVLPGGYRVLFEVPAGYTVIAADQGADSIDSDADPAGVAAVTVESGDLADAVGLGLVRPGEIAGTVWSDGDADGVRDVGEVGRSSITVELHQSGGPLVGSVATGADGSYSFDGLPDGTYVVRVVVTGATTISPRGVGIDPSVDSDVDPATGESAPIVLSGTGAEPVDAGVSGAASIGDLVWWDTDADGVQDDGEVGAPGVEVRLLDGDGTLAIDGAGVPVPPALTAADGSYRFQGLADGDYRVEFVPPFGAAPSPLGSGSDPAKDSDADPADGHRTSVVSIVAGDEMLDLDAGFVPVVGISGSVFVDADGSGDPAGQPPLAGVTLTLTGTTDGGAPVARSAVTDSLGRYEFDSLESGTYTITQTQPAGYFDSPATPATVIADIVVTPSSVLTPHHFGEVPPLVIGDRVWSDLDGDGVQEAGEPGVAGVTLELLDPADAVIATTTSGPSGAYSFANDAGGAPIGPGAYRVRAVAPAGFGFSPIDQGVDDATDSDVDPTTAVSTVYAHPGPVPEDSLDIGLFAPAIVTGIVWDDLDADGVRGTEPGFEGATVELRDAAGVTLATAPTAADGTWTISTTTGGGPLHPGSYWVQLVLPPGTSTSPTSGASAVLSSADSDADRFGATGGFVAAGGAITANISVGLIRHASIGDRVWLDADGDGSQDPDETGLGGVSIALTDPFGSPARDADGDPIDHVVTDSDGAYQFGELAPGDYRVEVVNVPGWLLSPSSGLDLDNDLGSDIDPETGASADFTVTAGSDVDGLDIGAYRPLIIGDRVWADGDGDAVQGPGEGGVVDVEVLLLDSGGAELDRTTTDSSGLYHFPGRAPGSYMVEVRLPPGPVFVARDASADDTIDSDVDPATGRTGLLTFVSGDDASGVDAGAVVQPHVAGSVYNDLDADGVRDSGEIGIPDVVITLSGMAADGQTVSRSTTTDATGRYTFAGVPPASAAGYTLAESQPADWLDGEEAVGAAGGEVSGNDLITGVPLGSAGASVGYDFGEYAASSLGGSVYYDGNLDGSRQGGERGLADVRILLSGTDDRGQPVSEEILTGANGEYSFEGLRPGTYAVSEEQPDGALDGPDRAGTAGGSATGADEITNITLPPSTAATGYLFGEVDPELSGSASVDGRVFVDRDADGSRDPEDILGVAGVTVELRTADDVVVGHATSDATGYYSFANVPPGDWSIVRGSLLSHGESSPAVAGLSLTDGASASVDFGLVTGSLTARVFVDVNTDGIDGDGIDGGEPGIPGVRVDLTGIDVEGGPVAMSRFSDGDGRVTFDDLLAGTYRLEQTQPVDFDDGPELVGSAGGLAAGGDVIDAIELPGGVDAHGYGFAEHRAAGSPTFIAGTVFLDLDENGVRGAGEPGVAGVVLNADDGVATVIGVSGLDGGFLIAPVAPTDHDVVMSVPAGYTATTPTTLVVAAPPEGVADLEFGLVAGAGGVPGRVQGVAYLDLDRDGVPGPGDLPLEAVEVTLRDGSGATVGSTTTDMHGQYRFDAVVPGAYEVHESQPSEYANGSPNTVAVTIPVSSTAPTAVADFAELAGSLSGAVFVDVDGDGARGPDEPGIPGVELTLRGPGGDALVSTSAAGVFEFDALAIGTYELLESQPAGFADGVTTVGSLGGSLAPGPAASPDHVIGIAVDGTADGTGYTFGELVGPAPAAARVEGVVWIDVDRDGVVDLGEPAAADVEVELTVGGAVRTALTGSDGGYRIDDAPVGSGSVTFSPSTDYALAVPGPVSTTILRGESVRVDAALHAGSIGGDVVTAAIAGEAVTGDVVGLGGVELTITGTSLGGDPVNRSVESAADGSYTFDGLPAGTYRIEESQPFGYADGDDVVGSLGGVLVPPDAIGDIVLGVAGSGLGYRFTEVDAPATGAFVAGVVFVDHDRDGLPGPGDGVLPDADVELFDLSGTSVDLVLSDGAGRYQFDGLTSGLYTVVVTVPAGYGTSTPPSRFGVVVPDGGVPDVDFGLTVSTLRGSVVHDLDGDGMVDAGEPGIAGVGLDLTGLDDAGAAVSRSATTGVDGRYVFSGVLAGDYTLTEVQPGGWVNGSTIVGSHGGTTSGTDDTVVDIGLPAGVDASAYGFTEIGPGADVAGGVAGVVWLDRDRNGTIGDAEPGLHGVVVRILDDGGDLVGTTVTGPGGAYAFGGLWAGDYQVVQEVPPGHTTTTPDVVSVTVPAGAAVEAHFGDALGSLSGQVFVDFDLDGVLDPDERPLGGVVISVDGRDVNGALVATSTVTDLAGRYRFDDLVDGTYRLVQQQPVGYLDGETILGAVGGLRSGANVVEAIALEGAVAASGYDFTELDTNVQLTAVRGVVFLDASRDGVRGTSESGVAGLEVELRDGSGNVVARTISGPDGSYVFAGIAVGTYQVVFVVPAGYGTSTATSFGPVAVDGGGWADVDVGLTLHGVIAEVFEDVDADGERDPGEAGIEDVVVRLSGVDDLGRAVERVGGTDETGKASFGGVYPGSYVVTEEQPDGWLDGSERCSCADEDTAGEDTAGEDTADEDTVRISFTGTTEVVVWFGELTGGAISGRVWDDADVDGVQDDVEAPIGGVSVSLLAEDASVVRTTTSGNDGQYTFRDLVPGSYRIQVEPPAGLGLTLLDAVAGDDVDNDVDPATTRSALVAVGPGASVDLDVGLHRLAYLDAVAFVDPNGDSVHQDGEQLRSGVTVEVVDGDGRVVATAVTGADGRVSMVLARTGTYLVRAPDLGVESTISVATLGGQTQVAWLPIPPGAIDDGNRDVSAVPDAPASPRTPGVPGAPGGLPLTGGVVKHRVWIAAGMIAAGLMIVVQTDATRRARIVRVDAPASATADRQVRWFDDGGQERRSSPSRRRFYWFD